MVTKDEVKKLKVQELKDELQARGLETTGLKAALVERLETAISDGSAPENHANGKLDDKSATEPAAASDAAEKDSEADPPRKEDLKETAEVPADTPSLARPPVSAAEINSIQLSEEERRKLRAQRFGSGTGQVNTAEMIGKLKDRAKRFGLPQPVFAAEEAAKKKARAERFNLPKSKEEEDAEKQAKAAACAAELAEKKRERAERFGIVSESDKAAARAKRFATEAPPSSQPETEKLKARAQRFAS